MFSHGKFYSFVSSLTVLACLVWLVWQPQYAIAWRYWCSGCYLLCIFVANGYLLRHRKDRQRNLFDWLRDVFVIASVLSFDVLIVGAPVYFLLTNAMVAAASMAGIGIVGTVILGSYIHSGHGR